MKQFYFSGIGGIGISALAQYYKSRENLVRGSDKQKTSITPFLEKNGIPVCDSQVAENITKKIHTFFYSDAVPINNPERQKAKELQIPQKSYFQGLGEISAQTPTIAFAGTHGKTTTTAIFAKIAKDQNFSADFFVGSVLPDFNESNFYSTGHDWLVCEACEFKSNFLHLSPQISVITSVDWDHLDCFPTEKSYLEAFRKLIQKSKTVFIHTDEKQKDKLLSGFQGEVIEVFLSSPTKTKLIGDFNQRNIALALAVSEYLKLNTDRAKKSIVNFAGIQGRQEFLGAIKNSLVFYDYAHHPVELKALFTSFREKYPDQKLSVIFEFHQYSRAQKFFHEFIEVFKIPDTIGLYPIYPARETSSDFSDISREKYQQELPNIQLINNEADVKTFFSSSHKSLVLFSGAGHIGFFAKSCVEYFKKES